jgi:hypothetical protein
MTDDSKISQRYRELAREEPPRHVDEAILAAARRAAETRPAPLVVPSGRRRWYFPLAAAAVIVLAVAVTVQVERQHRDVEVAEGPVAVPPPPEPLRNEKAAAAQAPAAPPAVAQPRKSAPKRELYAPDPKPAPAQEQSPGAAAESWGLRAQREIAPPADLPRAPASPAPPPAPQDAVSGAKESARADVAEKPKRLGEIQQAPSPAPQARPAEPTRQESRARASSAPEAAAVAGVMGSKFAYASPEQWLQGIADLRRQRRHEEADKALAEFRRAYPDYRISEAMLEKVEKK